jgi:hypothetical protein
VQPRDQRGHRFAGGVVALMRVGDEEVVGHTGFISQTAIQ